MRASHMIDGGQPALVCAPETPDQVAVALRLCSEAGATVTPYGGGTAIAIGNAALPVDVALDLNRLNRVVEHDHANLTATVEAGITLTRLQELLAQQKQFAPFDPPHSERATVGGIIATNLNGPRRSYYGSVRDLVIGMKVVLASGEPIKAGGKVSMELMAKSTMEAIGLTQISEILSVKEVVLVGPYPGELQTMTTYTGVLLARTPHPEAAQAFLQFLTSPSVQARFTQAGYELPRR